MAIARAKELFAADYAECATPFRISGECSREYGAIDPGDTILGMSLPHGGHLTHGSSVNFSGKLYKQFNMVGLEIRVLIDYDEVEDFSQITSTQTDYCWIFCLFTDSGLAKISSNS